MYKRTCVSLLCIGILVLLPTMFVFAQNISFSKTLRRGSSVGEVRRLQEFLKTMPEIYPEGLVTGYFGILTERAVKKLQTKYGLETVGIVGPKTRKILNSLYIPSGPPTPPLPLSPIITPGGLSARPLTGCGVVNTNSFFACYYEGTNFEKLKITRSDPKIDFSWFNGSPDPALPSDAFSVRWQGKFDFDSGDYLFSLVTDDSARVYINGEEIFNKWYGQPIQTYAAIKTFTKGVHEIVVEYYENTGQSSIQLLWAKATGPSFKYGWNANDTLTGEITRPTPVPRPVVILNGTQAVTLDSSAALKLADKYNIILVNNETAWDENSATMLLETMRRIPDVRGKYWDKTPWQVSLTHRELLNDVEITPYDDTATVRYATLSKAAFTRSNPALQPSSDGNSHRVFYSNELFKAVLKTFFNKREYLNEILEQRYGVKPSLVEPVDEFQDFNLEELQYIASVFEDMPEGFWHIPGLNKIARRLNGLTNPWSPAAPAIAWISLGYIEFMDFAFTSGSAEYINRLVAHEITHFLWHKVLKEETKKQFMDLSGWSETPGRNSVDASLTVALDHPKAKQNKQQREKWYRTTTTNFASDYAAAFEPDEDFAETVSYYIYNPDKVRNIAPTKYNFVHNVINGYEYVILVDEKYTFQVFNLEPDLTFPGKIVGVDIEVTKLPNDDNEVRATISLSSKYGGGAAHASTRIMSPQKTLIDIGFDPLDGNRYKLQAKFIINKKMASGYWIPGDITVQDQVDNRRYEGQGQFGWLLYINNTDADLEAPVPDLNNITSEVRDGSNDEKIVRVYVPVTDKNLEGLSGAANIVQKESNQSTFNYAQYDQVNQRLVYEFTVRKYHASGGWSFREFWVSDRAGNDERYDLKERALFFEIATKNPDYVKPELDLNSVRIKATPVYPQAPNGETDVTIWYKVRDDNSGIGWISYVLLKPNGDIVFDYDYHDNFYTEYFVGSSPSEYKEHEVRIKLPPGSPPGTWILREIVLHDKAENISTNNFIETGILRPFDVR